MGNVWRFKKGHHQIYRGIIDTASVVPKHIMETATSLQDIFGEGVGRLRRHVPVERPTPP